MKWIKIICSLMAASFIWTACQKESSEVNNTLKPKITVSKSEIKPGEPVALTMTNKAQGSVSRWTVTPNTGINMDSMYSYGGNTVTFMEPGTYTIQADVRIIPFTCLPTPGWDTCYTKQSSDGVVSSTITVKN